jgi:mannose-6-phosphate isomerase class I
VPTHAEHFYDVHRIEFDNKATVETNNVCHVMMLVEGKAVLLETADGTKHEFAYAETFVVPAAAGSYTLNQPG